MGETDDTFSHIGYQHSIWLFRRSIQVNKGFIEEEKENHFSPQQREVGPKCMISLA